MFGQLDEPTTGRNCCCSLLHTRIRFLFSLQLTIDRYCEAKHVNHAVLNLKKIIYEPQRIVDYVFNVWATMACYNVITTSCNGSIGHERPSVVLIIYVSVLVLVILASLHICMSNAVLCNL